MVGLIVKGCYSRTGPIISLTDIANVLISDCQLTENGVDVGNSSEYDTGVFYIKTVTKVSVTGSRFRSNVETSIGGDGGALNVVDCRNFSMTACTFEGNYKFDDGGGLALENVEKGFISSSTFFNNTSGDDGGAAYLRCTSNRPNQIVFYDCFFKENVAADGGGGFALRHYTEVPLAIKFEKCIFSNNTSFGDDGGGAIQVLFNETNNTQGLLTVLSSTFSGNTADWQGGAIAFLASGSLFHAKDSLFINNMAEQIGGGAIKIDGVGGIIGKFVLNNVTFERNSARRIGGALILSGEGGPVGGQIRNSAFLNNTAMDDAGAIFYKEGFGIGRLSILNSVFRGNGVNDEENGIIAIVNSSIVISKCGLIQNWGSAVVLTGDVCSLQLECSVITANNMGIKCTQLGNQVDVQKSVIFLNERGDLDCQSACHWTFDSSSCVCQQPISEDACKCFPSSNGSISNSCPHNVSAPTCGETSRASTISTSTSPWTTTNTSTTTRTSTTTITVSASPPSSNNYSEHPSVSSSADLSTPTFPATTSSHTSTPETTGLSTPQTTSSRLSGPSTEGPDESSIWLYILLFGLSLLLIIFVIVVLLFLRKKKERKGGDDSEMSTHLERPKSAIETVETVSDIQVLRKIAKGNFGAIYLAKWEDDLKIALKQLLDEDESDEANQEVAENLIKEASVLSKLNHPNVVRFFGVHISSGDSKGERLAKGIYLCLEYCRNGSLLDFLKGSEFQYEKLFRMITDVAKGMKYIASKGIMHRDLACRNCLVDAQEAVKISDFGMSRESQNYVSSAAIPIRWAAPEVLDSQTSTPTSDVYSFGVLLWEVLEQGTVPWNWLKNHSVVYTQVVVKKETLPQPKKCPDPLYKLLKRCCDFDPEKRPNFRTIANALSSINPSSDSSNSDGDTVHYEYVDDIRTPEGNYQNTAINNHQDNDEESTYQNMAEE